MKLGIELLPDFLDEAELAKLGEYCAQEAFLLRSEISLSNFEEHWFGLTEVASCHLA